MRAIIVIFVLVLFSASINLYIYNFHNPNINLRTLQLWYGASMMLALVFYKIDLYYGDDSYFHVNFRDILFWSVICNLFTTFLLHYLGWGRSEYKAKYYIFNGSVLAVSALILILGVRHGAFKKTSILSNA